MGVGGVEIFYSLLRVLTDPGVHSVSCKMSTGLSWRVKTTERRTSHHISSYTLIHGCANNATEGKRFNPPIHCCDVMKPPYLFSGELCNLLDPSTLNACLCTQSAVGAAVSASLCSEHVNQTSYWRSGRQMWEKLRHRAMTQCATLAHPWPKPFTRSRSDSISGILLKISRAFFCFSPYP